MNFLEHRFTLDVRRDASKVCVRVRKGDTARRLRIALVQGVVPYEIRSDCYAMFSAVKPDGNRLLNPCVIEDNRVVYELTPQTTAVIGLVECEIRLYGADDALITSPGFDLIVDEVLYDEDKLPQSETEVNALTGLISDAAEVIAEGREMIGKFGSALGQIEGVRDEAEAAAEEAAEQARAAADAAKSVNTKLAEELAKEIEELKKRPTSGGETPSRNSDLSVACALNDGGRKPVRALISFADDDCRKEVYYRVDNKPSLFEVIQNYNIPYTLACPPGNIRPTGNPKDNPDDDKYLTWTDVKAMYNAGVDIACHHWRQYNMDDTGWYPTIDSYAADLQQCMDKFAEQGIDVQGVAYPQGKYVPEYIPAVKKHYHWGLTVDRGINRSPYATYYLNRCEVFPDTSAYKNDPTLALKEAKARVDDVAQNGGWLIFMTHAWYETFNAADLGALIEYIQSQGIEIVSVADALKATGNVIEVGDFRKTTEELEKPYFVVDATGNVYANSVQEYTNYTEKVTEMQVGWRGEGNWYLHGTKGTLHSHEKDTNRRVSVDIPVSAGEKYRISCSSVWDGAAYVVLTAADGAGNRSVVDIVAGTSETPYTIVNREITIPDGGAILRLSTNISGHIQPGGYKIYKVEYIGAPTVNSPTNAPTLNGPESILSYGTVLSADEVCVGKYGQGILEPTFKHAVATKDFVKPFVVSATLNSADYQFAVVVYKDGVYVKTEGWLSNGTVYAFDHTTYQYKLYIGQVVNGYVYDFDACRKSIVLTISTADILKSYNALEARSDAERRNTRNAVQYMMRRNYDISYANAPAPIGLTTYVGNNQIVHPKVLYFPNKFGGYKYWMAYTPYPFANDVHENPCVAYSNDGYNWANIDGNPLDDPGGDGYNSDTHLVYVESTGTLEIWYRYVSNYETTPVSEIIYRQTTKDGINWTEIPIALETVISAWTPTLFIRSRSLDSESVSWLMDSAASIKQRSNASII